MSNSKIFGIGLSKTGTTSLANALQILGYRVRDNMGVTRYAKHDLASVDLGVIDAFDALTDTPIPSFYRELDARYPGSRFILTVRDAEGWLKSCKKQFTQRFAEVQTEAHKQLFLDIYGTDVFDERRFAQAYERFVAGVKDYFKERPGDLLVIDVTAGQGWDPLCGFLGLPVPDIAFPKANVTRIRWMAIDEVVAVAMQAGTELMRRYEGKGSAPSERGAPALHAVRDFLGRTVRAALRDDGVQGASRAAERAIADGLTRLNPQIPVLSRLSAVVPYETRRHWNHLWLVDPLDGEGAFAQGRTDFSIDIALIEDGAPIYGVVYAPAAQTLYYSALGKGVFQRTHGAEPIRLDSAGHGEYRPSIGDTGGEAHGPVTGSSHALALCATLSRGTAQREASFGPSMEWQTAAAHAILRGAGKCVRDGVSGRELGYNKKDPSSNLVNVD